METKKTMRVPLSADDIQAILEAFNAAHGTGYQPGDIGRLQAKLSMTLAVLGKE